MKQTVLLIPLLFLSLTIAAQAGEPKVITLKDGSIVQGRIVAIDNGNYIIENPTIGQIKVPESNVVSIVLPSQAAAAAPTAPGSAPANAPSMATGTSASQMQAVQGQIMSNPAIMADIQALMQDPDVTAALSDPAFVQAAQSGNTAAVQSSPQLQRLMANPRLQAIIQKIQAGQAK
jgi:hypothetical protein